MSQITQWVAKDFLKNLVTLPIFQGKMENVWMKGIDRVIIGCCLLSLIICKSASNFFHCFLARDGDQGREIDISEQTRFCRYWSAPTPEICLAYLVPFFWLRMEDLYIA